MTEHHIELDTGVLRLQVRKARFPLDDLCGFAARDNPKRGFLFVSKVLGKHWPVTPSRMREIHAHLARRLELGPGPWLCIAMAETATGLGQGVFEALLEHKPDADALFVHSTRYHLPDWPRLEFQEPHCHAPQQLLYEPFDPHLRERFRTARELILIDDEISTGSTFCNLAAAYQRLNPNLERVHFVAITVFSGAESAPAWSRQLGLPVSTLSALEAELTFTPAASIATQLPPSAVGDNRRQPEQLANHSSGRLGVDTRLALPEADIQDLARDLAPGAKVLMLGTGEYMHLAYRIGLELEARGLETQVQATTRSPIRLGADIQRRLVFQDNYGEGIANYLYNVDPAAFDRIILCHETPIDDLSDLVHNLGPACMTYRHPDPLPA
ncbi:phosphoribosyltransferase domain-containing protein [Thiorhodovibrio frisius]|uniref:Phosphoribosyl transferase family protein n=1 Tax=Thiorhodovibrio frisius TaxID=631362 RepID=H8Z2G1_9GAMM|nr:phosphoribosyltransferase domain-containing protein [Thiorhodovibrio frisius]EIC21616.1 Protein of unknown function (DUF3706) [Thiorhodovibrio frisius]WPL21582.1 hypothetical protein Thiofri_01708 [Thiorhodovibrio frisius]